MNFSSNHFRYYLSPTREEKLVIFSIKIIFVWDFSCLAKYALSISPGSSLLTVYIY